jgi:ribosomal protein L40E
MKGVFMAEWKCVKCGWSNSSKWAKCAKCGFTVRLTTFIAVDIPGVQKTVCIDCGVEQPLYTNYCSNCHKILREIPHRSDDEYNKVSEHSSVMCFCTKISKNLVFANPDTNAERLYIISMEDYLPVLDDESNFYSVLLPGKEKGYVLKSTGMVIEMGVEEVKTPFGYVRSDTKPNVISIQPNGETETIYTIIETDRLPIVAQRRELFMVQLQNGFRGWVHKSLVIRTISPTSIPIETANTSGLAQLALGLAAIVGLGIIGGLSGDPDEQKIRRAVDNAMRDKGL